MDDSEESFDYAKPDIEDLLQEIKRLQKENKALKEIMKLAAEKDRVLANILKRQSEWKFLWNF